MRERLESPVTAVIITVLAMMTAALLGGRASLTRLRVEAWELYTGGYAERAGEYASIQYDLGEIASNAANLCTVAERYELRGDPLLAAIRGDCEIVTTSPGPAARKQAAETLKTSVEELDDRLEELPLVEEDRAYQNELTANIESRYRTIGNNAYNISAAAFNKELARQPAALIAEITGVERLELYCLTA